MLPGDPPFLASEEVLTPERTEALRKVICDMNAVASIFYGLAARTNCHTFIEFTGFMTEYIKLCEDTLDAGYDFTAITAHSDTPSPAPFPEFRAEYLGEKFGCIFLPWFKAHPEMFPIFLEKAGLYDESKASSP